MESREDWWECRNDYLEEQCLFFLFLLVALFDMFNLIEFTILSGVIFCTFRGN